MGADDKQCKPRLSGHKAKLKTFAPRLFSVTIKVPDYIRPILVNY